VPRLDFYSLRGWRVVKKKTSWKTWAGLVLAAGAWRRLSEDLPIHDLIPEEVGPRRLDPPQCGRFETAKWDAEAERWRCVPKGLL